MQEEKKRRWSGNVKIIGQIQPISSRAAVVSRRERLVTPKNVYGDVSFFAHTAQGTACAVNPPLPNTIRHNGRRRQGRNGRVHGNTGGVDLRGRAILQPQRTIKRQQVGICGDKLEVRHIIQTSLLLHRAIEY